MPILSHSDVKGYVHLQQIASAVEQPDMVGYWKSAPYLLNFMDKYDIKRTVTKLCNESEQPPEFVQAFRAALPTLLSSADIEAYSRIDAGNAQMRAFHGQTIGRGLWKLLWLPASRPYYQPAGAFADPEASHITKQLVFSCWKVVPKAVAALLSYEADPRSFEDPFEALIGLIVLGREPHDVGSQTLQALQTCPTAWELVSDAY